jgi:integrase
LSEYACEVLQAWNKVQVPKSPFVFPSPHLADQPISTVKTAWKATLRRAGVAHFPIYNLRHVFCTRLSGVAADAVVQRAMRHTSPETKRRYQLGMTDQVRQAMEKSNKKAYGRTKVLVVPRSPQPPSQTAALVAAPFRNASRSALIVSASVVGMPCGKSL